MDFKFGTPQTNVLANRGHFISFKNVHTEEEAKFKALLTNFSDQYTSEWEQTRPYGRMDPIMNFKYTGREITVGFDVVAGSLPEARYNLGNLSLLAKMLYPSYELGGGGASLIKDSPFFEVKMLNLISSTGGGLLCTLRGFTYSPNLDMGAYDDDGHRVYPKSNSVEVQLTILHQHSLNRDSLMVGLGKYFPYNYSLGETNEPEAGAIRTAEVEGRGAASKQALANSKPGDNKNTDPGDTGAVRSRGSGADRTKSNSSEAKISNEVLAARRAVGPGPMHSEKERTIRARERAEREAATKGLWD